MECPCKRTVNASFLIEKMLSKLQQDIFHYIAIRVHLPELDHEQTANSQIEIVDTFQLHMEKC